MTKSAGIKMEWKDEIRKTIYRQLPGAKNAYLDFEDATQLHKRDGDDIPIWEKTAQAVHEEVLFSDEESAAKALKALLRQKGPQKEEKDEGPSEEAIAAGVAAVAAAGNLSREQSREEEAQGAMEEEAPSAMEVKPSDERREEASSTENAEEDYEDAPEALPSEVRAWLLQENIRLESLRKELARASAIMQREAAELEKEKQDLAREKEDFSQQMQSQSEKLEEQKRRLGEDQDLFDKKYKVLEMGFAKLNEDKKAFEAQKRAFEYKRKFLQEADLFASMDTGAAAFGDYLFFKGVNHPLAVKKRYKDLIKIYHPDNMDGDKYILQRINQEYDRIRRQM